MKIGLCGCGTVGRGVVEIIDQAEDGYCAGLKIKRILDLRPREGDPRMTTHYEDILQDPEIDVVMECIGGDEPSFTYVRQALESGRSVISSNKKMLAAHLEILQETAARHGVHLLYEAAAGGGIPWLISLRHIRQVEPVLSFAGILNGTTNYILDAMDHSSDSLADALARAQQAGYAEKDPFDDLAGLDVRCKVVLSCAEAFDEIPALSSVPVFGLQHLSRQDLAYAQEKGGRIKLLGRGRKSDRGVEASVLPVLVSLEDPFAHVVRNLNRVECTSAALGTLALEGQGAGSLPTAHAMVEDALCLQEGRNLPAGKKHLCQAVPSPDKHRYYLRSSRLPENLAGKKAGPQAIVSEPMDMSALLELVQQLKDPEAFVMEADHD